MSYAFCAWAGKHLCGAPQGGPVAYSDALSAGAGAWVTACSQNGSVMYAYGGSYLPVCNTTDTNGDGGGPSPVPVGSLPQCQGPPGVYDLMGNASEWIDSCEPVEGGSAAGNADACHHLGGASSDNLSCFGDDFDSRDFGYAQGYPIGFPCCSP